MVHQFLFLYYNWNEAGRFNSPWLCKVYINNIIARLRNSGYDFYLAYEFVGCLFFDYLFQFCTCKFMLNICKDFEVEFDMKIYQTKYFLSQLNINP